MQQSATYRTAVVLYPQCYYSLISTTWFSVQEYGTKAATCHLLEGRSTAELCITLYDTYCCCGAPSRLYDVLGVVYGIPSIQFRKTGHFCFPASLPACGLSLVPGLIQILLCDFAICHIINIPGTDYHLIKSTLCTAVYRCSSDEEYTSLSQTDHETDFCTARPSMIILSS